MASLIQATQCFVMVCREYGLTCAMKLTARFPGQVQRLQVSSSE